MKYKISYEYRGTDQTVGAPMIPVSVTYAARNVGAAIDQICAELRADDMVASYVITGAVEECR